MAAKTSNRPPEKKPKEKMITKSTILSEYGWTESLIKHHLPAPTLKRNPHYATAPAMKVWPESLVIKTMQSEAFQKEYAKIQYTRLKQKMTKDSKQGRAEAILLKNDLLAMMNSAKRLDRHFILHCGPTNSGKTYQGLEALKKAKSGVYLGPLRLLALEVFDSLNGAGVPCNLLTGEESEEVPFANITASTIEMLDDKETYDVAVIDEAQLIADRARGGAWTKAILSVKAKEVHICFAPEAFSFIESLIKDIGASYEVIKHERLTPLVYSGNIEGLGTVEPGDAFITFSRKSVLQIAAILEKDYHVHASVIYGALPPDSRRREVHRFETGETTVVVATDAIGMGISLPIKRIIFCSTTKFDGVESRPLRTSEINQIAGRAGRFGKFERGEVLVSGKSDLIERKLGKPASQISKIVIPFPKEAIDSEFPLKYLLETWQKLPDSNSVIYEDMSEPLSLLRDMEFDSRTKPLLKSCPPEQIYECITCPVDAKNADLVQYWLECCNAFLRQEAVPEPFAGTCSLEECEVRYKQLDIMHQMMRRYGIEMDTSKERSSLCKHINSYLKAGKSKYLRTCRRCGESLPFDNPYSLCQSCYKEQRQSWWYGYDPAEDSF